MQSMKILEGDGVLLSQPLLIEQFGRAGAQFLSQLHYWLNHNQNLGINHNGNRWIYNSAESWAQQLQLSVRQIRRLIAKFIDCKVLKVAKLNPHKSVRTNYYSIDYKKLHQSLVSQQSSQTSSFTHSDILSSSSCHNGTIYNDTKITNKELNKSEKNEAEFNNQSLPSKNKFKQVKNLKNIDERNRVGYQELVLSGFKSTEQNKVDNIYSKQSLDADLVKTLPKTSTAQIMLKVWNDTFEQDAKMSKELAPMLVSAYSTKFSKDIKQWNGYIAQIKSSSYLNSEKFNLSIFWALKFSIIDRIRAGEFGVKDESLEAEQGRVVKSLDQVHSEIDQIKDESVKALELRKKILQVVGVNNYISWFQQAKICEQDDTLSLIAPNSFVAQTWEVHFDWVIKINDY